MGQHMHQYPAATFVQGLGEFIGTQFFRLNSHGGFRLGECAHFSAESVGLTSV